MKYTGTFEFDAEIRGTKKWIGSMIALAIENKFVSAERVEVLMDEEDFKMKWEKAQDEIAELKARLSEALNIPVYFV